MAKCDNATGDRLKAGDRVYLKSIGLSREGIRLYELLLRQGVLTAREAGELSGALAAGEYRLLYELEERGLVRRLPGRPRRFAALALSDGLQASLAHQEQRLKSLLDQTAGGLRGGTKGGNNGAQPGADRVAEALETGGQAHILVGRQKVYEIYAQYARQAKKQICIYAIGIAYTLELAKVQAGAVKRGVEIRHVVQEVKAANYYVISRWLQLGIALRTLKRPRGYHLTIVDDVCAIVTFSDPADTEQRVSLLTTDPNTIAILQAQFEPIWAAARPLKR